MATLYSDIYIDGMNTEILAADGAQIKEAWLDGKCIWKLQEGSSTLIYCITYYEDMYYAIGSDIDSAGNRIYCVLVGKALDDLDRYDSKTKITTSLFCWGISANPDGLFLKCTYWGYDMTLLTELRMKYIDSLSKTEEKELYAMFLDFAGSGLTVNAGVNICDSNRGVLYAYPRSTYVSTEFCRNKSIAETFTTDNMCYKNMHVLDGKVLAVLHRTTGYLDVYYSYDDYVIDEKVVEFPIIKAMNLDYDGKIDVMYNLTKHCREFMEELIVENPSQKESLNITLDGMSVNLSACNDNVLIIAVIVRLFGAEKRYDRKLLVEYKNGSILEEREIAKDNTADSLLTSIGGYFLYQYVDDPYADSYSENEQFALMTSPNSYIDFSLPLGLFGECSNYHIRENKLCMVKAAEIGKIEMYEVDLATKTYEHITYNVKSH